MAVPTSISPSGFIADSVSRTTRFRWPHRSGGQANILRLYPAPQLPYVTNNYYSDPARIQTDNTMDARIDHRFTDRDTFYVRYSWNHTNTTTPHNLPTAPNGIDPVGNGGGFTNQQNQNIQLNNVYTINPNTIAVVQGSYSRWALRSLQTNFGKAVATQLGVPGVNVDGDSTGIPGITLTTAQNIQSLNEGTYQPNLDYNNTFQENASLQFSRGKHSLKTGVNFIRRQVNETQSSDARGTFTFSSLLTSDTYNTNTTGNGLASFELGYYNSISRSKYLIHPGYRFLESGVYFQDDWRATKWLTLNLGMRWDYYSPVSEQYGRIPNWNWAKMGLSAPGEDGMGNTAGVKKDWLNLAPRFGFAAQLNKKTVLRGGFGVNYAPDLQGTPGAFRNAPYNYSVTVNPATATSHADRYAFAGHAGNRAAERNQTLRPDRWGFGRLRNSANLSIQLHGGANAPHGPGAEHGIRRQPGKAAQRFQYGLPVRWNRAGVRICGLTVCVCQCAAERHRDRAGDELFQQLLHVAADGPQTSLRARYQPGGESHVVEVAG